MQNDLILRRVCAEWSLKRDFELKIILNRKVPSQKGRSRLSLCFSLQCPYSKEWRHQCLSGIGPDEKGDLYPWSSLATLSDGLYSNKTLILGGRTRKAWINALLGSNVVSLPGLIGLGWRPKSFPWELKWSRANSLESKRPREIWRGRESGILK